MKSFLALIALLALSACSKGKSSDEGSGTRGGGDACEIDVHQHLDAGFDWIAEWGRPKMTAHEAELFAGFPRESLKALTVDCSDRPIVLDNVRKSVYSRQLPGGGFTVQVDETQWFATKAMSRSTLAVHEILVMAGIEQTGDYHLSTNHSEGRFMASWVDEVSCRRLDFNKGSLTFDLIKAKSPQWSPGDPESFTAALTINQGLTTILNAGLGKGLDCYFEVITEFKFGCFQPIPGTLESKLALELTNEEKGARLKIYWENLSGAELTREEFKDHLEPVKSYIEFSDGPVTSLLLFSGTSSSCDIVKTF